MRDSLTKENARDFHRRYTGTFGFFVGGNKRVLVHMAAATESEVTFMDKDNNQYLAYADSGVEFEFIPVNRGFYNTEKQLVYLQRIPARQWQRGISATNTAASVYDPKFRTPTGINLNLKLLDEIFVHPMPLTTALQQWREGGRSSVALSKHFALVGKRIQFYSEAVGHAEKNTLTVTNHVVSQELRDCVQRQNLGFEVING